MTLQWSRHALWGVTGVGVLAVGITGVALYHHRFARHFAVNPSRAETAAFPPSKPSSPPSGTPPPQDEELSPAMRDNAMGLFDLLKKKANLDFQEGRFEAALKGYQDCIDITHALGSRDREAVKLGQVACANAVMCYIKLKNFDDASLVASFMLDDKAFPLESDLKVKVLFRRGLSAKALDKKEAALADFRAAMELSPGQKNPAAEREIAMLL
ncbi:unnamed protein product [Phytomonas sp. Hart1]|nr:unnamed protein product [Phytomonas sp. Hart1]|eukprot:CCW68448.1 unnamed protein product [Phytomonas sp. isolate Hart1]